MNTTINAQDSSITETGAHGPPKRRRPFLLLAAFGIAVAGVISPAAAQAAPVPPPAATIQSETQSLQHAAKGTKIHILNDSSQAIQIGDTWLPPRVAHLQPYSIDLEGASGRGDDISSSFRVGEDGDRMPLYGHNPVATSAYLQVGGQKIFESSTMMAGGVQLDVKFNSGNITFKGWTIRVSDGSAYDHQFVHHTDNNDGIKGFVRNQAPFPVTIDSNGVKMTLKPGQKMIYFDSREVQDEDGTSFSVSGNGDPGYYVEAFDPNIGYPLADVRQVDGDAKQRHSYSEGDEKKYQWGKGMTFTVKREDDAKLPVPFENWHTEDWANFTFTISAR